ncbi:hypothetical protein NIES4071_92700 [Calothrix sp. NIES-4071]|nr:hypothetical protein NIES4071_92700 [Calothrix sp. NIES-4071]BAZ63537.1 hypothetical protein NIES4105_92630 [Calothrix sp. NIES-4105]
MPLNESLRQYPTAYGNTTYSNSNQDIYTSVNANTYERDSFNQKKLEPSTLSDSIILFAPVLFVLTTVGIVFYRFKQVKTVSLPCKKCKYYDSNNYLKCAVNPAEVMTEKSKDCRDYTAQERKFSWSWKGFNKR